MKIKLAILENDKNYLNRVATVFGNKYADKLEVYSFTDPQKAIETVENAKIDVLLVDESYNINSADIPASCGFAYLVNSADIQSLRNEQTVAKFQMAELIYKQVLSIFSETTAQIAGVHFQNDGAVRILSVVSAMGGAGSSTVAAAMAVRLAMQQKRVLYLNLERFGSADTFFTADGGMDFSDVIYALKGKNTNVQLKMQSSVKQDRTGVFFYSECKNALDISELNCDDNERLLETIRNMGDYEYIVLDMDLSFSKECMQLLDYSEAITIVSDGTAISNEKTNRAINSLKILDDQKKGTLIPRMRILYNKFSSKGSEIMERTDMKTVGGIPKYEGASVPQLLQQIGSMAVLDEVL